MKAAQIKFVQLAVTAINVSAQITITATNALQIIYLKKTVVLIPAHLDTMNGLEGVKNVQQSVLSVLVRQDFVLNVSRGIGFIKDSV